MDTTCLRGIRVDKGPQHLKIIQMFDSSRPRRAEKFPRRVLQGGTQSARSGLLCNFLTCKDASSHTQSVDVASTGLEIEAPWLHRR